MQFTMLTSYFNFSLDVDKTNFYVFISQHHNPYVVPCEMWMTDMDLFVISTWMPPALIVWFNISSHLIGIIEYSIEDLYYRENVLSSRYQCLSVYHHRYIFEFLYVEMDALAFLLIYVVLARYFEPIIVLYDLQSKLFILWVIGFQIHSLTKHKSLDDSESKIDLIFHSLFIQ